MRVLILDDDVLIALDLQTIVSQLGHDTTVVHDVESALRCCGQNHLHFAILDFNLGDHTSEPLADHLMENCVPFVFLSGYTRSHFPDRFQKIRILSKPLDARVLENVLSDRA